MQERDPGQQAGEGQLGQLEKLALMLERMNLADLIALQHNPWRLMWLNFLAGSARGVGLGFGFAILSAGLLYILRGLMMANLPVIGDFIATIVRLVEHNLAP